MLTETRCTAFNVFMRKRDPALRCAVRQDRPVPSFIQDETWDFGGTATLECPMLGLDPEQASEATRLMGYHLFSTPQVRSAIAA